MRLLRGSGEDAVQRRGTVTAEQGSGAGRSCAGEARFRVAARADDGVRGIRGVLFKGRRVTWACAPGREGAARSQAGITAFGCAAGGGKKMTPTGGSGRAVREERASAGVRSGPCGA